MNFSGVITVYFPTISMLCYVEVKFVQLLNLIKTVPYLFTLLSKYIM